VVPFFRGIAAAVHVVAIMLAFAISDPSFTP
jgi:hypothetical protein